AANKRPQINGRKSTAANQRPQIMAAANDGPRRLAFAVADLRPHPPLFAANLATALAGSFGSHA
ncbi:MAG TPA: hypothetical protein VFW87_12610, partial [Pirellulales bacterium]|nr:hypothetical protein [Pirellulales bacterium]